MKTRKWGEERGMEEGREGGREGEGEWLPTGGKSQGLPLYKASDVPTVLSIFIVRSLVMCP